MTKTWKVYGVDGHRQRETFYDSFTEDFSKCEYARPIQIEVQNFDKTSTHEYSIISITGPTEDQIDDELWGQLSDGIFENSRVGSVELIEIKG